MLVSVFYYGRFVVISIIVMSYDDNYNLNIR